MSKDYPWGKGTPRAWIEATANDSSQIMTVPTGKTYLLKSVYSQLATTATVGNRIMVVQILDPSNNILYRSKDFGTQAASLTYSYMTAPGLTEVVTGTNQSFAMPEMILPAGWKLKVFDRAVIDAAADDLSVWAAIVEYDA